MRSHSVIRTVALHACVPDIGDQGCCFTLNGTADANAFMMGELHEAWPLPFLKPGRFKSHASSSPWFYVSGAVNVHGCLDISAGLNQQ